MSRQVTVNTVVIDTFNVLAADGLTKVTGLIQATDFAITVFRDGTVVSPFTVTIAEILDGAVAASGTYTGAPAIDGDTVTIGARVYTFRNTPLLANEVNLTDETQSLVHAINGTGTPGTDYGVGTAVNSEVSAVYNSGPNSATITALIAGTGGNSIATTTTGSGTWGAATSWDRDWETADTSLFTAVPTP